MDKQGVTYEQFVIMFGGEVALRLWDVCAAERVTVLAKNRDDAFLVCVEEGYLDPEEREGTVIVPASGHSDMHDEYGERIGTVADEARKERRRCVIGSTCS